MGRSGNYTSNKNSTNNKINKIVDEIKEKIEHQSKIRIGHKYLDFNYLNFAVTFATLVVSFIAMYTSYKISTNNSALNFTYENIEILGIDEGKSEKKVVITGKDLLSGSPTLGNTEICIDTKVITGQIDSIYLIQKRNNHFIFSLLNNEIQDKSSGTKKYKSKIFFEMDKLTEYKENNGHKELPIGMAQMYILSVDINKKINIDVIQIIGQIAVDIVDKHITIYSPGEDYAFRYLKNNKLVTFYNYDIADNNDINEGWVNLTDKYLDITPETDIKVIEEDIAAIKDLYSKF